jgi:hypothetical protein
MITARLTVGGWIVQLLLVSVLCALAVLPIIQVIQAPDLDMNRLVIALIMLGILTRAVLWVLDRPYRIERDADGTLRMIALFGTTTVAPGQLRSIRLPPKYIESAYACLFIHTRGTIVLLTASMTNFDALLAAIRQPRDMVLATLQHHKPDESEHP